MAPFRESPPRRRRSPRSRGRRRRRSVHSEPETPPGRPWPAWCRTLPRSRTTPRSHGSRHVHRRRACWFNDEAGTGSTSGHTAVASTPSRVRMRFHLYATGISLPCVPSLAANHSLFFYHGIGAVARHARERSRGRCHREASCQPWCRPWSMVSQECVPSLAQKKTFVPNGVRPYGSEDQGPGMMSFSALVPTLVPSVRHPRSVAAVAGQAQKATDSGEETRVGTGRPRCRCP